MANKICLGTMLAAALTFGSTGALHAQNTTDTDKKFIDDSTRDSLVEINLAKLALQKSQDKNVREFATKMIHDHEMLINNMKPLAAKYGVKLASSAPLMGTVHYDELKMKSGTSFDRAYVEDMVKDHNEDLQKFIEEKNKTTNADVKATVTKGEAVIRQHTEMIDKIAQQGGIQTPPLPGE